MGKSGTATTRTVNELDPIIARYRGQVIDAANAAAREQGRAPYGGETVAGATPGMTAGSFGFGQAAGGLPAGIGALTDLAQGNGPGAGQLRSAADGVAGAGATLAGYADGSNPYMKAASGFASGPLDISKFFNPYQKNVVDATGGYFDKLRTGATLNANDQATRAGAFGGSRHGVAEGVARGEISSQEGRTVADLLRTGYTDATGAAERDRSFGFGSNLALAGQGASAAGNLFQGGIGAAQGLLGAAGGAAGALTSAGLAGAGGLYGAGQAERAIAQQKLDAEKAKYDWTSNADLRKYGILQGLLPQLPGTTSQTSTKDMPSNPWGTVLGGLGTIFGGPLGGMISGGLGSLFGGPRPEDARVPAGMDKWNFGISG